jgi:hypothetical protein
MLEPDCVELLLRDRTCDYGGYRARSGKANGQFQRIQRTMRSANARMPRPIGLGRRDLKQRQAKVESGIHFVRIIDDRNRPIPNRRERVPIADRDERGQPQSGSIIPAFGDDFGTDSSRITQRDRKR